MKTVAITAIVLVSLLGTPGPLTQASDVVTAADVILGYDVPLTTTRLEAALFDPGSSTPLRENIVVYLLNHRGTEGAQIVARALSTGSDDLLHDTLAVLRFDVKHGEVIVALRAVVQNNTDDDLRRMAIAALARSGDCSTLRSIAGSDTEPSKLRQVADQGLQVARCSEKRDIP